MKKIALDTNIVIDILNGKIETAKKIKQYQIIYLPVTVCKEKTCKHYKYNYLILLQ